MGLDVDHVISDVRHYGAFVCAICQNLVDLDGLVTTVCSHVFCKSCLQQWLERPTDSYKCPNCNRNLLYSETSSNKTLPHMMMGHHCVMVQPLQSCQPLAHRVVSTVLVKCPLQGVACKWKGDYGDLQSHLTSQTAHLEDDDDEDAVMGQDDELKAAPITVTEAETSTSVSRIQALATSLKEQANSQFASGHYKEARSLYQKAISVLQETKNPDDDIKSLLATLYSNNAATKLSLQEYNECIDDCRKAIAFDATYVKVYIRWSRACIQQGHFVAALAAMEEGLTATKSNLLEKEKSKLQQLVDLQVQGNQQLLQQQYASAKSTFGQLLRESSGGPLLLGAAKADLGLGLTDSALTLTMRVLQKHSQNPEACLVRGQVMFLMDDMEVGLKWMQQGLRLDPDSASIKATYRQLKQVKELLETARQEHFRRKFDLAVDILTQAISKCQPLPAKSPMYATLYTQRAEAYLRLKQYDKTLKDCALVVYAQEDCIPAWLIQFQAHHGLGQPETALQEVTEVLHKLGNGDARLRGAYETADFQVRKQKRTDFYKLFAVPSIASEMEIKKAYKRKALELHPDKQPPEKRPEAQRQFQMLGEGLEILCDDFKRKLYDEGYDMGAIRERVESANRAAHHHGHGHH
jgi:DnaJ family protein C protein 7